MNTSASATPRMCSDTTHYMFITCENMLLGYPVSWLLTCWMCTNVPGSSRSASQVTETLPSATTLRKRRWAPAFASSRRCVPVTLHKFFPMTFFLLQCFPEGTDMTSILDFYFQVHTSTCTVSVFFNHFKEHQCIFYIEKSCDPPPRERIIKFHLPNNDNIISPIICLVSVKPGPVEMPTKLILKENSHSHFATECYYIELVLCWTSIFSPCPAWP